MKRTIIVILIIIALVLLVVFRLIHNKKALDEQKKPVQTTASFIPVKTAQVTASQKEVNIVKTGNIAAFEESKIIATTAGTVVHLGFSLGSVVRQGQVLAVLDSRLLQLDLQKAEENEAKTQNDLKVYSELLQGKAATQEKVDQLRLDHNNAVNAVERAKRQITDAAVKAPISGMVAAKQIEQGVYVNTGAELGTIVNIDRAKIQVNLTENEVYLVHLQQPVKISSDVYPGKTFNGTISFISPQADVTHSYRTEIIFANGGQSLLRSGTFVYVDFSKKTQQQILQVPREAIVAGSQQSSVYVVEKNVARLRSVRTGSESKGMTEVLGGLQPGEEVVISGQINLKDGTQISVSK